MMDSPLHELYNNYNSKPRTDVKGALHGTYSVNQRLAEQHFIQEPESTRANIDTRVFDKMTKVEEIIAKRDLKVYLGQHYISKRTELQDVRNAIKSATKTKENDEIVNDIIGG